MFSSFPFSNIAFRMGWDTSRQGHRYYSRIYPHPVLNAMQYMFEKEKSMTSTTEQTTVQILAQVMERLAIHQA